MNTDFEVQVVEETFNKPKTKKPKKQRKSRSKKKVEKPVVEPVVEEVVEEEKPVVKKYDKNVKIKIEYIKRRMLFLSASKKRKDKKIMKQYKKELENYENNYTDNIDEITF